MKRIRIKSIGDLEKFIQDETVTLEDRLTVFTQTLNSFPLFVLSIRLNGDFKTIDNPEAVLNGMLNTLNEIKGDPNQKTYTGFTVLYRS